MGLGLRGVSALAAAALGLTSCSGSGSTGTAPAGSTTAPTSTGASSPPEVAPPFTGRLAGRATLSGDPPVMKVPALRRKLDYCNRRDIPINAVLVKDGRLRDVFVRIENGGVPTKLAPPKGSVLVRHTADCVYEPRMQGAVLGQTLEVWSEGKMPFLPYSRRGQDSWLTGPPAEGEPARRELDVLQIFNITCTLHTWERAFVIVTDHPFFAVSDPRGAFAIGDVPPGTYTVEAWHSRYGWKRRAGVQVRPGETAELDFAYSTKDEPPEENRDELVERP